MKVHELKSLIKPLIKECLKEVLIEEGFMKMLSETKQPQSTPAPRPEPRGVTAERVNEVYGPPKTEAPKQNSQLQEAKKKMLDAIGGSGFDAFAGTQPLNSADSHAEMAQTRTSDPGVDISGLLGNKQAWKKALDLMEGKKTK